MTKEQKLNIGAWALSIAVVVVAVASWGQLYRWHLNHLTIYKVFPLLGLVAYGLMWSHYITSVARQILGIKKVVLKQYFEVTSLIVLISILLHPGLLWFQLWRDGFGLPPQSYLQHYVAPSLRWAAVLGTVSLFIFLTYELRRKFETKAWWKYITYATDFAMLAILVHALRLGSNLQDGWLRYIWYFYGLTLLLCLGYIYNKKLKSSTDK